MALHKVSVQIGRDIKRIRQLLGMERAELAKRIGVSKDLLRKYESGESNICVSRLDKIATIFGIPIMFFFGGSPEAQKIFGRPKKSIIK